jgi:hypothetical protein
MIVISRLIWDSWNVAHIARHEVVPDEVEEVCHGPFIIRQTYDGSSSLDWANSIWSYASSHIGTNNRSGCLLSGNCTVSQHERASYLQKRV